MPWLAHTQPDAEDRDDALRSETRGNRRDRGKDRIMQIPSYPKVWNLGHRAVIGLTEVSVYVEEKLDGSQFSFGIFDGELMARSRGQQLVLDAPEQMFARAIASIRERSNLLTPGWTYRGEYLQKPKHNTLAYDRVPVGHIAIFDIDVGDQDYLHPEAKRAEAERIGLECVPLLFSGDVDSMAKLDELLDSTSALGGQKIEGVVLKPVAPRFGEDGKCLLAKYVSERFKEIHAGEWKKSNPGKLDVIESLVAVYGTEARREKAVQHLSERGELTETPKDIGAILKEIGSDTKAECREEISARLFEWAWPQIQRGINRGTPEWYKRRLAAQQFTGTDGQQDQPQAARPCPDSVATETEDQRATTSP